MKSITTLGRYAPGLCVPAAIAAAAYAVGALGWCQRVGMSALTLAILFGMLVGNTAGPAPGSRFEAGMTFARQKLLRLGIVLYGLRLTLQDLGHVGVRGILIDVIVLTVTFAAAVLLGTKLFKLERNTAILIGAGSAICGAAAVMATEPVVRARGDQVAVAIATVVVFGTGAMFIYPALYHLSAHFKQGWSPVSYGIYAGSTIHEVAQVLVAGRAISDNAADTAVIEKLARVMMLAPFLAFLAMWLRRENRTGGAVSQIPVPWFAVLFVLMACFNSLHWLPKVSLATIAKLDTVLLAMAMAALGLSTRIAALAAAGIRPLALGAVLFIWLMAGGAAINGAVNGVAR